MTQLITSAKMVRVKSAQHSLCQGRKAIMMPCTMVLCAGAQRAQELHDDTCRELLDLPSYAAQGG